MNFHRNGIGFGRRVAGAAAVMVLSMVLSACGAGTEKWAYIHEPGEEILELKSNGKAVYKSVEYTYSRDSDHITLTDAAGKSEEHRYVMDGDRMVFYERSVYTLDESEPSDGIIGVWKQDNGWQYQFTKEGKFSEESIFFGSYLVDEAAGTIKLMYDDPIEDALLYYELDSDGKHLTIDYPWPMVAYDPGGTAEKEGGTIGS